MTDTTLPIETAPHEVPGLPDASGILGTAGPIRTRYATAWVALLSLTVVPACGEGPEEPTLTRAERLQAALDGSRRLYGLIGVSAAVIAPGHELWTGASGVSHPGVRLAPETLLGIGSVTKTFTAALLLDLAEDGLLSLDDALADWLPPVDNVDGAITLRQLLNHTSGLFDYFVLDHDYWPAVTSDPAKVWEPEEALRFVEAPRFPPGSGWEYSNTNYVLLGLVLEQATGSSVSALLNERLRRPLGLTQTFLEVEEPAPGTVAHGWSDAFDGDGILDDVSALPRTAVFGTIWTSGAMFSTAGDLARWATALYEGELLAPTSMEQMLAFHPVDSSPWPGVTGYGLGVARTTLAGREIWGHGGTVAAYGYAALLGHSPDDGATVALLFNHDVGYDVRLMLAAALFAEAGEF